MALPTDQETLSGIGARARAFADFFHLPLKDRTWRGNSGDFMGSGVGSSLDFQDHRAYLPGDDPRHINWQAYARTGHYSMKLYREEVRPFVEIIFDVSDSLFFDPGKANRSLELFYFCHFATIAAGASTSYFLVKGKESLPISAEAIFSHQWADQAASLPATDSSASPDLSALPFRAQSLRVLISDLLFPSNPEWTTRDLSRGKGGALILCPYLRSESDPSWDGNYEFVDSETADRHDHRVDRPLLEKYLAAYQRHFETWKRMCLKFGISMSRLPCEPDFETAVQFEAIPGGTLQM